MGCRRCGGNSKFAVAGSIAAALAAKNKQTPKPCKSVKVLTSISKNGIIYSTGTEICLSEAEIAGMGNSVEVIE